MCHREQIAKAILSHDRSQIEYYEHITLNMVVWFNEQQRHYRKKEARLLSRALTTFHRSKSGTHNALEGKIETFKEARGDKIWSHRKKSSGYTGRSVTTY